MKRSMRPDAPSGATAIVRVLDAFRALTVLGSNVAVTPVGSIATPRVTGLLLLPCRETLTVTVFDWPSPTLSVVADSESETSIGSGSVEPSPPPAHAVASWVNKVNVAQRRKRPVNVLRGIGPSIPS
jgi:hypothetical protein